MISLSPRMRRMSYSSDVPHAMGENNFLVRGMDGLAPGAAICEFKHSSPVGRKFPWSIGPPVSLRTGGDTRHSEKVCRMTKAQRISKTALDVSVIIGFPLRSPSRAAQDDPH